MKFTRYQSFVVAILAFLQFTLVLDFMILSPLGAILLPKLHIATAQFGFVVSAYAFSAGISGLLTAGFADRFDRKKLLLFFYSGFILGTALCGLANSYYTLLFARIITGLFGGVIGSISMAIIADLFSVEIRGRVMGFVQTAFAASQVLGLPIGLALCNKWGWHAPFLMIAGIGASVGLVIAFGMKPIDAHLRLKNERNPFEHLAKTVSNRTYLSAFVTTIMLAVGGFMMMPFGSTFSVNNLGVTMEMLPTLYLITGVCSIVAGPLIGRLSDSVGKYRVFFVGSMVAIAAIYVLCNLGRTPFWAVCLVNLVIFLGISTRMITVSALISAVPEAKDRGAFMSIYSSLQQFAGGLASALAGVIVIQRSENAPLERYWLLGDVVVAAMLITVLLMYSIHLIVKEKTRRVQTPPTEPEPASSLVGEADAV